MTSPTRPLPSVAIIVTARPSYAKVQTLITALLERSVPLHIFACASALLERYGRVVDVIRTEFPTVSVTDVWSTYEGTTLVTAAKETGALLIELASCVARLQPDLVCVVADRHEVLAAAQSVAYLHVPLVHLQGGERSGSVDDRVRDSISQLANVHCVATERAALRVYGLTGATAIHVTGCPSIDLARQAQTAPPVTAAELGGAGIFLDPTQPFLVVLQHPVTTELAEAAAQMQATLAAVCQVDLPRLVLWPGEDAGAEAMSKRIRLDQAQGMIHTLRTLPPARFLRLLTQATVLVGNSSAGIREASFLGTPVVNIGTRQQGRARGPNVVDVPHDVAAITAAIQAQRVHGPYPRSRLYGDGTAGQRIARVLCEGHREGSHAG